MTTAIKTNLELTHAAGLLGAQLDANLAFRLSQNLLPERIIVDAALQVTQALGTFEEAEFLHAKLATELIPGEIKQGSLHFSREGDTLGNIQIIGSFSFETLDIIGATPSEFKKLLLHYSNGLASIETFIY